MVANTWKLLPAKISAADSKRRLFASAGGNWDLPKIARRFCFSGGVFSYAALKSIAATTFALTHAHAPM